jgi:hypothetical protein
MGVKETEKWKSRSVWLNFWIGVDQTGNAILPALPWPLTWPGVGNPDKTISYTLGALKLKHGGRIPWRWPFAKLIDAGLELIDKNHSIEAYYNGT